MPSSATSAASTALWSAASSPISAGAISVRTFSTAFPTPLPEPGARIAVAELDRLELPGRGARRHGGAPDLARVDLDVDLDRRVAARIEDLPRADGCDPRAHRSISFAASKYRSCSSSGSSAKTRAVVVRQLLGALDPIGEAPRRRAQRELGVDVQPPRDVDRREQHVADLLEDVRDPARTSGAGSPALGERLLQLAQLVVEIGERPVRVRVLEVDRRRPALELARVEQRRQRLGDVVEDPFAPLVAPS